MNDEASIVSSIDFEVILGEVHPKPSKMHMHQCDAAGLLVVREASDPTHTLLPLFVVEDIPNASFRYPNFQSPEMSETNLRSQSLHQRYIVVCGRYSWSSTSGGIQDFRFSFTKLHGPPLHGTGRCRFTGTKNLMIVRTSSSEKLNFLKSKLC